MLDNYTINIQNPIRKHKDVVYLKEQHKLLESLYIFVLDFSFLSNKWLSKIKYSNIVQDKYNIVQ